MPGTPSSRYGYGAGFTDRASGVRFEGHHPVERPDLWKLYLDGAEARYRSFGFGDALRRQQLEDGQGVSLFLVGIADNGEVVAGVRCHGPLDTPQQAALLSEMGPVPDIQEIERLIETNIPLGLLEIKGAWSKGAARTGHRLLATMSRGVTHATRWLGAEFAIAAVADYSLELIEPTGVRLVVDSSIPYPDERYRTIIVGWRRSRSSELATPEHAELLRVEADELGRRPLRPRPVADDDAAMAGRALRPIVLDEQVRADREVLRVVRHGHAVEALDRLAEQQAELARTRPDPPPDVLAEPPAWVYYPWRRTVVRLLGHKGFERLRLDRNRNKLTREEQNKLRGLRIGVVGLSSGHAIAHLLAMEGIGGELRVADFDDLELSNLNRLPATVLDLGLNKAVAASRRISEIDPYLRVVSFPSGVRPENIDDFLVGLDVVVDACDSIDLKLLLRERARAAKMPVLMQTSDCGVLDVERFDLDPDRLPFHGRMAGLSTDDLIDLSIEEKAPHVLRILGAADISSRAAASLLEIGSTLTAWPQLASEVTLGAATIAAALRRLGLGMALPSGRVRVDLDVVLADLKEPPPEVTDRADRAGRAELPESAASEGLVPVEVDLVPPVGATAGHPSEGLNKAAALERIVTAAMSAPSGGNSQPWRFEGNEEELRFYMLPERTSLMDVSHRASLVAVGAALLNARVRAAALGVLGTVQLFPEGSGSHHVATMSLEAGTDPALVPLAPFIADRTSNRNPSPDGLDVRVLDGLRRAVEHESARLRRIDPAAVHRCAEILGESDRIRMLTPGLHLDLFRELRWRGGDPLDDGIDVHTLELGPNERAALDLMSRPEVMRHLADWRAGDGLGRRTRRVVESGSDLVLITVPRPDPHSYVRGGNAVERLWLEAARQGLSVQPISPIFLYALDQEEVLALVGERYLDRVCDLAEEFRRLWGFGGTEAAVLLLRIGHAEAPSTRSLRRPLAQVFGHD